MKARLPCGREHQEQMHPIALPQPAVFNHVLVFTDFLALAENDSLTVQKLSRQLPGLGHREGLAGPVGR